MAKAKAAVDVDRDMGRLAEIADELDKVKATQDMLYAERLRLWGGLVGEGVKQTEMAKRSRVSPMAVGVALHKQRSQGG